ncbi:DUF3048 domain-containing protein [Lactococcus formosensis subsp. formosensis]|uniref:DUF3048 domain-containing protein n=1 Tax=Lactococcus formosensis TaxID=1281486 RepID=UPI0031331088
MKKKVIAIIIALLVGAVGLFLWQTKVFAPKTAKEEVKQEEKSGPVRSELTGLETTADKAKRPITAVMVENSPEARPQSGLKDAGVVFEAVAEGGITRFVALYQEAQPDLIGPVRSIRPYFVEWTAGFDAGLAHVGGSELALNIVKSGDYVADLDQFKAPEGIFWRSEDRVAPHNMYTKMSGLDKYMAKLDKKKSDFQSWDRQALNSDKTESDLPAAQAIRLPVSTGIFEVSYHYDTASKTYQRFQGGEAHQDREKGQISPDVVIAIMVNQKLSADGNHMDIETTGTGKAYIFRNGKVQEGNWAKSNAQTNIRFTDGQGNKIPLKSGQTWITAIDNSREVIWE